MVDAFVGDNAAGNPAGVLLLDRPLPDDEQQATARLVGVSETAFLTRRGPAEFGLRWFTPTKEIDLCGHATLASAAWLWATELVSGPAITFHTKSGVLPARRRGDAVELNFPQDIGERTAPSRPLLDALGLSGFVNAQMSPRSGKLLIEVATDDAVRHARPDMDSLMAARPNAKGGVIITSRSHSPYDFTSRYFHPWAGVDEDPVTGSAHCLLAGYWSRILGLNKMRAFQCSRRGGVLEVDLREDGRVSLLGRVKIRGLAPIFQAEGATRAATKEA